MRLDIPALMASEAVVVLPGWERSRGASLEVWIALDLDVPVFRYCESEEGPTQEFIEGLKLDTLQFDTLGDELLFEIDRSAGSKPRA